MSAIHVVSELLRAVWHAAGFISIAGPIIAGVVAFSTQIFWYAAGGRYGRRRAVAVACRILSQNQQKRTLT